MVGCKRGLINLARRHGHLRSRPKTAVSKNPKAWWIYAIGRVLKPVPTTEAALKRAKENIAYVGIYSKLLLNQTDLLLEEEKAVKDKVEWERGYDELKDLREVCIICHPYCITCLFFLII